MSKIPKELYEKIVSISQDVKNNLREKGLVVPTRNKDKSISVGNYNISKDSNGFFHIKDFGNKVVVEKINLPQTAIIIANKLALGKFLDTDILQKDRMYGYAVFEDMLFRHHLKNNPDLALSKFSSANLKKEFYKNDIFVSFEKLRKLV